MKKIIIRLVIVAVIAGAAWSGYMLFQQMPQRQQNVATTRVRRGDVIVRSYARGELRAVRSATLTAPNLFGTVQVTKLASLGSFAREKDLIVEFDDSEVNSRLEEKQLELDQIDEQMKKAQADLAIRDNQDQVELLRTRYSVRRAELEVKRNELISAIDAKKNLLTLDESRRRLKQLESDIKSRREQAQAELAVLRERRNKALLELARERQRLSQVKLLAPMSGLIAIKQNRSSVMMFGMQLPDIREGDQVQPGMQVADVLDLSELEVVAKVGELDRANLREDQEVIIQLDAIAEKKFTGTIKSLSGTASANMFSADPAKKFDVVFSIDMKQLLSALGAKPEQIARVLATAEANRKKPAAPSGFGGMMGGMMMAGMQGGMPSGPGGESAGGPMRIQFAGPGAAAAPGGAGGQGFAIGGPGGPGGAGGPGASMTPEQQQQMREAMQKALGGRNMQDLSPEERQKVFAKLRESMPSLGQGRGRGQREPGAEGGEGRRRRGGEGAEGGEGGPGQGRGRREAMAEGGPPMTFGMGGSGQFSEKDLANAKLPPPPEEDAQLDVLLRPGLLADVEIIVEKLPNAIHLPNQAVFEKDNKLIVYLKTDRGFEERVIQPLKRSESTIVIASGVQAGDVVALTDPNAKPGDKKKEKSSGPPSSNPMVPGGAGAAPGGGGRGGR